MAAVAVAVDTDAESASGVLRVAREEEEEDVVAEAATVAGAATVVAVEVDSSTMGRHQARAVCRLAEAGDAVVSTMDLRLRRGSSVPLVVVEASRRTGNLARHSSAGSVGLLLKDSTMDLLHKDSTMDRRKDVHHTEGLGGHHLRKGSATRRQTVSHHMDSRVVVGKI